MSIACDHLLHSAQYKQVCCLCCRLLGKTAGEYDLSVTNSHGDTLKGSPFAISLQPGPVSPAHSSLELLPSTSIVAGSETQLKLNACDLFGNKVRLCNSSWLVSQQHEPGKQQLWLSEIPIVLHICLLSACLYTVQSIQLVVESQTARPQARVNSVVHERLHCVSMRGLAWFG